MLVYLHGLNSSSASRKALELRERLAPLPVLAPTYPAHRPEAAVADLQSFLGNLRTQETPLLLGSSMGGFYAQFLARHVPVAHLYLINPALAPWDLLGTYEGQTQTTADGASYVVDKDLIESTRRYAIAAPCDGIPTTLFLDKGDEVIDYRIAESVYADCGRLFLFDGGDHGFQHLEEAISVIREGGLPR